MSRFREAPLEILADADALARRAADWLLAAARSEVRSFAIALSGGSTPRRLYALLAQPPYREAFPWPRSHWFWGDERFVAKSDARSNERMVREALLAHVPVPPENIHAIPTEGIDAEAAAAAYEAALRKFYGAARLDPVQPLFDAVLLGLGSDGHTASLFPGAAALGERERWTAVVAGLEPETRITLTYPALESSRRTLFLVEGAEKRATLKRLRSAPQDDLPAARLAPLGALWIFADRAAAEGLA
ncbi:MAG TPA: 6-phosphogluconolactonase [Stellaceae bacterium]|nr:6-phosphogluconolactonase [Stellaceae bacterium]